MPRPRVIVWAFVVACLCSGFLHCVDLDTASLSEVLTVRGLLSTAALGLVLMVPVIICQLAAHRWNWLGLLASTVALGTGLGVFLALLGSTATTPGQWAVSLVGMSVLFIAVLLVGGAPAIWNRAPATAA